MPATRVTTADEFDRAFARAIAEPGPKLIEAMLGLSPPHRVPRRSGGVEPFAGGALGVGHGVAVHFG